MTASHWSGLLLAGPNKDTGDSSNPYNQGSVALSLCAAIPLTTGILTTEVILNVPPGCQISAFDVDVLTVYNSATSATFSAGSTSAGGQYASGVNVKASSGRISIATYTAAQLAAMAGLTATGGAAPIAGPLFLRYLYTGGHTDGGLRVRHRQVRADRSGRTGHAKKHHNKGGGQTAGEKRFRQAARRRQGSEENSKPESRRSTRQRSRKPRKRRRRAVAPSASMVARPTCTSPSITRRVST